LTKERYDNFLMSDNKLFPRKLKEDVTL